jgi:ligand-binding sensor protein
MNGSIYMCCAPLTNCSVQLLLYTDLSVFVACTGQVLPLPSQQPKLQVVTLYKLVVQLLFNFEATMSQAVPHCLACGSVTISHDLKSCTPS